MKLNVYLTESYTVSVRKKEIEIDTDDYPELFGLSKDDVIEKIQLETEDLYADDDVDSLYSKLFNQEISNQTEDDFTFEINVI